MILRWRAQPAAPAPVAAVIGPRGPATGQRRDSFASAASYTPNVTVHDFIDITALSQNLTINNPTGSIEDAARLMFRILDDGSSHTLTWGTAFRDGGVGLPSQTDAGALLHLGFIYHAGRSAWYLTARAED